jgi:predicted alpha/beta hydrolase
MTPQALDGKLGGEETELRAADGYRLGAQRYRPAGPSRARLVIAGATGVPQKFYRRFSQFASARGYDTLTLDYRGIGQSRPATLKGFRMNYLDWARLDLAAAVETMRDDTLPLYLVGHSYGGHAVGLLPNHTALRGVVLFATGAGWHGWMPLQEQLRVLTMWRVLGPLMTGWAGYLPWSVLGMGEDLPLDVYRQWRHWCSYPNYFFDDPELPQLREVFAAVQAPMVAVNALDDGWAPPASRNAFTAAYRGAAVQAVDLDSHGVGLGPVGHLGYFRPQAEKLWSATLDWFERCSPGGSSPFVLA